MKSSLSAVLGQTVQPTYDHVRRDVHSVDAKQSHHFQDLMSKINAAKEAQGGRAMIRAPEKPLNSAAKTTLSKPGMSEMTATQLSQHMDNFLKLLMAQLKHQDPMNPMEATDFTSQLVQFTSVEQQIAMNRKLESMIDLQKHGQDLGASYLLDRTVQVPGDRIPYNGQGVDLAFAVPSHLQGGYLVIKDQQGHIVHIKDVVGAGGYQTYSWSGVKDDGSLAEPGTYTTQIIAASEAGEAESIPVSMLGKVTGVYFDQGQARLVVAGQTIHADQVQAVHS